MSVRFWGQSTDKDKSQLSSVGGLPCANVVRSMVTYEADDGAQILAAGESAWDVSYVELIDINKSSVVRKLSGHNMAILDLSYLACDGRKFLVSCSADQEVRVFDLSDPTGQSCAMHKHTHRVLTVATPKEIPIVAGGSYDSSIFLLPKLVTEKSDTDKITLSGHTSHVTRVRFMPGFSGSNRLFSCSYDSTVAMWDVEKAKQIVSMKDTTADDGLDKFHDLCIHKDGLIVATGSQDKLVRLWDQRTGKCAQALKGHDDFVLSVVFGQEENSLISGSKDKTVRLWDLRKLI